MNKNTVDRLSKFPFRNNQLFKAEDGLQNNLRFYIMLLLNSLHPSEYFKSRGFHTNSIYNQIKYKLIHPPTYTLTHTRTLLSLMNILNYAGFAINK